MFSKQDFIGFPELVVADFRTQENMRQFRLMILLIAKWQQSCF